MKINITEEFESAENITTALNHIAKLIEQGYTSGHYPTWTLSDNESE
jgi:hypothetical protein